MLMKANDVFQVWSVLDPGMAAICFGVYSNFFLSRALGRGPSHIRVRIEPEEGSLWKS